MRPGLICFWNNLIPEVLIPEARKSRYNCAALGTGASDPQERDESAAVEGGCDGILRKLWCAHERRFLQ
jgi:hypothetical protein